MESNAAISTEEDTRLDRPPVERYGRYELVSKLASGGMGEVFVARSGGVAGFQKFVVIKKILPHLLDQPQFVEGLVREAKLLVMLDHPNIVQVLDLGVEGKDYFMAMEFVNGYNMATIAHYCAQKRLLIPYNAVVAIGLSVLAGLDYAHQLTSADGQRQNIVHRDVSPQNVMISKEGRVKLTDFGIAKVLNEAEAEVTQSLKGKFRYMAPEAVDGGRVDRRYDIFAAGILMFEGLCRRHLFGGRSDIDILNQVRESRVPPIERYHPNVPKGVVDATRRALARNPERRYQTAAAFARDLRHAILPTTETDANAELAAFVGELYERPDFPINKPKLPDLAQVDLEVTRSLVLQSHIPEENRRDPRDISGPEVAVGRQTTGGSRLVLWLILLMLFALTGAVGYLLISSQKQGTVSRRADAGTTPVIIVGPRDASVPRADLAAPPVDTSALDLAMKPDRDRRPPPKKCRPLLPVRARAVVQRKAGAVQACMRKHLKSGQAVKLTLRWEILRSGKPQRVSVSPAGIASTPFGKCLLQVSRGIRFPCHTQRVVGFSLPFTARLAK